MNPNVGLPGVGPRRTMPDVVETRAAVAGRSDEEILSWIASIGGTRAFIEDAFVGMREAFLAERAAGQSAVIEWDIKTPDEGVLRYCFVVEDGSCRVEEGGSTDSSVTLELDMANFLRLLIGLLDTRRAVEKGTLGVSGDKVLAGTIREWFRETN